MADIELIAAGTSDDPNQRAEGAWLDSYLDLVASGLYWKKAAFAAWFNAPKNSRRPGTLKELAELLNYKSEQVFYKWQQQAWFREKGLDKLRQMIFQRHIGEVDRQTISEAAKETGSAGVAARRLFYEQARLAVPVEVDVPVDSNFERALRDAYGPKNDDGEPDS